MDDDLAKTYGAILKRRSEGEVGMSDLEGVSVTQAEASPTLSPESPLPIQSSALSAPSRQLKPGWKWEMAGSGAGRWRVEGNENIILKVLVIGDPCVGKTSFVQRYVNGTFHRNYKGTIGVDFALKIMRWTDSEFGGTAGTVKVQLWDIAGQERYTSMTRVYYRDAHGCILMFDLTNRNSFLNVVKWKRDFDSKCVTGDTSPIPCLLVANKSDVEAERSVTVEEIERLCNEFNFASWAEVSVKDNLMVEESMKFLIAKILERSAEPPEPRKGIHLNGDTPQGQDAAKKKKSACACGS